jgi:hypothetical protein
LTPKTLAIAPVASFVSNEFCTPEATVLRGNAASLAGVGVPIATVDEDNRAKPLEYEIRLPGQVAAMKAVSIAGRPQSLAHRKLWLRVLRANQGHPNASFRFAEDICHQRCREL